MCSLLTVNERGRPRHSVVFGLEFRDDVVPVDPWHRRWLTGVHTELLEKGLPSSVLPVSVCMTGPESPPGCGALVAKESM